MRMELGSVVNAELESALRQERDVLRHRRDNASGSAQASALNQARFEGFNEALVILEQWGDPRLRESIRRVRQVPA